MGEQVPIRRALELVATLTAYMAQLSQLAEQRLTQYDELPAGELLTRWDYELGVYGPVIVLLPCGDLARAREPLEAVVSGWAESHGTTRPDAARILRDLPLSVKQAELLTAATRLTPGYNVRLRADLAAACGLPDESQTNYFQSPRFTRS